MAAPSDIVLLVELGPSADLAFPVTHDYFEVVYGPLLGPAAVVLARSLHRRLASDGKTIDLRQLAHEVGLRASPSAAPLGSNSSLRRALDRLEHLRIVRLSDSTLAMRSAVAPVPAHLLDRLPPRARATHNFYVDENIRPGTKSSSR